MPRVVKVAIIGSGLAGLTAAFLLSQSSSEEVEFDVHVFEKVRPSSLFQHSVSRCTQSSTLGMDSASMTLPVPGQEKEWRVDVPMRSFQGGSYRRFLSMIPSEVHSRILQQPHISVQAYWDIFSQDRLFILLLLSDTKKR